MSVGFKGFAKPAKIDAEKAKAMTENVSSDEFIIWTGNQYGRRRASGRSACLNVVTTKMTPMPLSDYVNKCLTSAADGKGYDTSISVGGLSLHQIAKPTVYFYCVLDADGNYVAKKDIPNPDQAIFAKPLSAGDVVLAAQPKKGQKRIAKS